MFAVKWQNHKFWRNYLESDIRVIESPDPRSLDLSFNPRPSQCALCCDFCLNPGPAKGSLGGDSIGSDFGFHSRSSESSFGGCAVCSNLSLDSRSSQGIISCNTISLNLSRNPRSVQCSFGSSTRGSQLSL